MIFDYSASWNIFELYICIERKRFLLKVSSIIISVGGEGSITLAILIRIQCNFSPGKIGEWNGGKKASRGKITSRTGSRRAALPCLLEAKLLDA